MAKIDHIWQDLENEIHTGNTGFGVKRLICSECSFFMYIGIFKDSMTHFLALEICDNNLSNYKCLPQIKGLDVNKTILGDERKAASSLVLAASSKVYNQSFDVLVNDLIKDIDSLPEEELIAFLADRLGVWRKFFSDIPCEVLSEEKQIGLAGELRLILKLLDEKVPDSTVVNSWKGYDYSSKDFIFSNSVAIEAKSSKSPKSIKISSEKQLDESNNERCFLFFCNISYANDTEYSLNIFVDQIRQQLDDNSNSSGLFESGLLKYGYYDIHRDFYNRPFSFSKEQFFSIEGNFPRIKGVDLRQGIHTVKYSIDLSNAVGYECQFTEILNSTIQGT